MYNYVWYISLLIDSWGYRDCSEFTEGQREGGP